MTTFRPAPLLERGFQIVYVETFQSSAATPFFDTRGYIPSGSDLLLKICWLTTLSINTSEKAGYSCSDCSCSLRW